MPDTNAILIGFLTALTTAIGVMWRQAVSESKRKDELIDRLLKVEMENAEANRQSVSLLREERIHP